MDGRGQGHLQGLCKLLHGDLGGILRHLHELLEVLLDLVQVEVGDGVLEGLDLETNRVRGEVVFECFELQQRIIQGMVGDGDAGQVGHVSADVLRVEIRVHFFFLGGMVRREPLDLHIIDELAERADERGHQIHVIHPAGIKVFPWITYNHWLNRFTR